MQVCVKPDKYTIRISQPQPKQVDAAAVLELRGVCCCVAPAAVWQLELDDQPDRVLLQRTVADRDESESLVHELLHAVGAEEEEAEDLAVLAGVEDELRRRGVQLRARVPAMAMPRNNKLQTTNAPCGRRKSCWCGGGGGGCGGAQRLGSCLLACLRAPINHEESRVVIVRRLSMQQINEARETREGNGFGRGEGALRSHVRELILLVETHGHAEVVLAQEEHVHARDGGDLLHLQSEMTRHGAMRDARERRQRRGEGRREISFLHAEVGC
eukprot:COSAG06_NODE_571_length_14101_cov_12.481682_15_plen_271_part_00